MAESSKELMQLLNEMKTNVDEQDTKIWASVAASKCVLFI